MKHSIFIAVLLWSAAPAFSQDANISRVNCASLKVSSPACSSFNEMITGKDDQIIDLLSSGKAYVCFKPDEDVFLVLKYTVPEESSYKNINDYSKEASGFFWYAKFSNGIQQTSQPIFGKWSKFTFRDSTTTQFDGPGKAGQPNASIDDQQVEFSYQFDNVRGSTTQYLLQVRRSTLRFIETVSAASTESKTKASKDASGATDQFTISGYCSAY